MKVFFNKLPEAIIEKIDQKAALQFVSNKIKWFENHEATISNWLITVV